ncbi:Na/Pi cotransporter family protein [Acetivibrio saccincola]|jgi:phosphate:Na+ symporter|uniref:Na+/Pi-cotransporter n=1 Tax=Acetivibrio saccincola TaxID=1677857 RepID=A0A2K9E906_9FIRM|nr:Na/Pi symporter [Acetivibrio saccincola]AUG59028.1 Na+/Pi-cotransporter [Acetivibrio saccincola]NLW27462.1 Na/Pi cotransporter family protein [Acetivibrio saccincola]PQQ65890.1 Na/Pi cotransporter [Acetivibrio saccincola]HOA96705.1 Na/Pi symporter [Acetivibrio saccincola]HQD28831.1 Na/Pi symporter [Acetivibrio saccincola]
MKLKILLIVLNFVVGTGLIMYGVNLMSSGLEKANVKFIKKLLSKFTGRVFTAFLTGTFLTALVQSSTAVTVITVGLVNSGLIKLPQAVGIIYGANIGTTITAQLMSIKVDKAAYFIVLLGILIRCMSGKKSIKSLGSGVIGLGLMFSGFNILNLSVSCMKDSAFLHGIFQKYGQNCLLGIFAGVISTMLVHSSSATVAVTIALFNSGLISLDAALGLMFGDNIGTCITAQMASFKMSVHGKRAAWAHTMYNIIGVLIALVFFMPFVKIVQGITYYVGQDKNKLIANAHTIFNIFSAVLFLPFTKYYVKFIEWMVPDKN